MSALSPCSPTRCSPNLSADSGERLTTSEYEQTCVLGRNMLSLDHHEQHAPNIQSMNSDHYSCLYQCVDVEGQPIMCCSYKTVFLLMNSADVLTTTIFFCCSYLQDEVQVVVTTTAKSVERLPPRLAQPSPAHATTPAAATLSPAILGGVSSDESHTQHIDDAQALMELTETGTVGPDFSKRAGLLKPLFKGILFGVRAFNTPLPKRDDLDAIVAKRQRDAQREERHRVANEKVVKLERTLARTAVSTHVVWM